MRSVSRSRPPAGSCRLPRTVQRDEPASLEKLGNRLEVAAATDQSVPAVDGHRFSAEDGGDRVDVVRSRGFRCARSIDVVVTGPRSCRDEHVVLVGRMSTEATVMVDLDRIDACSSFFTVGSEQSAFRARASWVRSFALLRLRSCVPNSTYDHSVLSLAPVMLVHPDVGSKIRIARSVPLLCPCCTPSGPH